MSSIRQCATFALLYKRKKDYLLLHDEDITQHIGQARECMKYAFYFAQTVAISLAIKYSAKAKSNPLYLKENIHAIPLFSQLFIAGRFSLNCGLLQV